jgi:hypothetical protein
MEAGRTTVEFGDEGGRKRRFLKIARVRRRTFSLGEERARLESRGMRENRLSMPSATSFSNVSSQKQKTTEY